MTQLLVRNLEPTVIKRLKERARLHGVAVEEEHRRILREVCLAPIQKVSLIDFLRNPKTIYLFFIHFPDIIVLNREHDVS
jgi:hypothetical protein